MTLKNVKDIVVGIIKQSFTNKKTLDKFDDSSGVLMYNGSELGTKINISEEENNAVVLKDDNSLFVEDKTEELQNLTDNFNTIKKYQKYENIELDYTSLELTDSWTAIADSCIFFNQIKESNMAVNESGQVLLKAGKTYKIDAFLQGEYTNITFQFWDVTNNIGIYNTFQGAKGYNLNGVKSIVYTPSDDIHVGVKCVAISSGGVITSRSTFIVQEIGRQIIIDPVEHLNTTIGLEDAPVGHIISHMGTIAPNHYLICDGAEYNINDYPYLSQHIIDNFGAVNHFGGDGVNTFAVPDLRGEFLRGTGTATRDTGSGSAVGEHQNATKVAAVSAGVWGSTKHVYVGLSGANLGYGPYDKTYGTSMYYSTLGNSTEKGKYEYPDWGTTRPTNTSVLYCIKYEPTYYTSVQNTNYLSASLYSLEERVIGSWIDGKPLYEKTLEVTMPDKIGIAQVASLTDLNIDNVINYTGLLRYQDNRWAQSTNATVSNDMTLYSIFYIRDNSLYINFNADSYINKPACITIQYTKTTDAENSFTNDMIKDYIAQSNNSESYSDDEINTAIADSINLLNEV